MEYPVLCCTYAFVFFRFNSPFTSKTETYDFNILFVSSCNISTMSGRDVVKETSLQFLSYVGSNCVTKWVNVGTDDYKLTSLFHHLH